MRAIWSGFIGIGMVNIPVKIYSAVDTTAGVSFRQVHRGCGGHVGHEKKCKKCGSIVEQAAIVKGLETGEEGQFVTFEPAELDAIRLKSKKVIEILAATDTNGIPLELVEQPYYVGSDHKIPISAPAYALLRAVLSKTKTVLIGKVILNGAGNENLVAIALRNCTLVMYRLRYPREIHASDAVPHVPPATAVPRAEEIKLMQTLLQRLPAPQWDEYKDNYGEALQELVRAKLQNTELPRSEEIQPPAGDIMQVLLAAIGQKKQ